MRIERLLLATMLMVAPGCDKESGARRPDLSERPPVLFQVFGAREDPRMIPVALVDGPSLRPLELSAEEWRRLDSLYLRAGASYTLLHDGRPAGTVAVKRGMWETAEPLHSLPNCALPIPVAAVTLTTAERLGNAVEFLALSGPAAGDSAAAEPRPALGLSPLDAMRVAREVGYAAGDAAGIRRRTLDSLDFRALAVRTGATPSATLVTTFIDPLSGTGGDAVNHVMVIADRTDTAYTPTFRNVVRGASRSDELARYLDRLDVDRDGVDEIFLEVWTLAGRSAPMVLAWRDGRWREVFRGRADWCLEK